MIKGEKMPIYRKPISFEEYEGTAELIRPLGDLGQLTYNGIHIHKQRWLVHFPGDPVKILRERLVTKIVDVAAL